MCIYARNMFKKQSILKLMLHVFLNKNVQDVLKATETETHMQCYVHNHTCMSSVHRHMNCSNTCYQTDTCDTTTTSTLCEDKMAVLGQLEENYSLHICKNHFIYLHFHVNWCHFLMLFLIPVYLMCILRQSSDKLQH